MKGECADRAMDQYSAVSGEDQVLVVLQYARVVEVSEGWFLMLMCFD